MRSAREESLELPGNGDALNREFDGGMEDGNLQQIKKRKKEAQLKRVVCVPIAGGQASRDVSKGLSPPTDSWAWRKYGQKPIKGSPYPRGYYRCSSSKGCSARKQVERSRRDPSMLIVTYTAEHDHAAAIARPPSSCSSSTTKHHAIDADSSDQNLILSLCNSSDHGPLQDAATCHDYTGSHHHYYSMDDEQKTEVTASADYDWRGLQGECVEGEWLENEYYYIIDEKKDNMSLCFSRCEDDDLFSELGMLPELASIFNKRDEWPS